MIVAVRLRARLSQNLDLKTLMGWPELDPEGHPIQLMTDGLCAKIRHPRYAQITLTLLGYALVTNYLAVYAVFLLWLPAMYGISVLEERELRDRFGNDYERYSSGLPRFVPRLRKPRC